jgi:hypothetical protein
MILKRMNWLTINPGNCKNLLNLVNLREERATGMFSNGEGLGAPVGGQLAQNIVNMITTSLSRVIIFACCVSLTYFGLNLFVYR